MIHCCPAADKKDFRYRYCIGIFAITRHHLFSKNICNAFSKYCYYRVFLLFCIPLTHGRIIIMNPQKQKQQSCVASKETAMSSKKRHHNSRRERRRRRFLLRSGVEAIVLSCLFFVFLATIIPTSSGSNNNDSAAVCSTSADGEAVCSSQEQEQEQLLEIKLQIAPTEEEKADCKDDHEKCSFWASVGECDANPAYMKHSCQKSCHTCPTGKGDPDVLVHVNSWGEPQEILRGDAGKYNDMGVPSYDYSLVYSLLQQTQHYMEVLLEGKDYKDQCKHQHKSCTFWASIGECEKNPAYMEKSCAPVCESCHKFDYNLRCPKDDDETLVEKSVWKEPGDLDGMFMNLLNDPRYEKYEPVLYSKPDYVRITTEGGENNNNQTTLRVTKEEIQSEQEKLFFADEAAVENRFGMPIIQNGPWVVTLENFLTQEECDTLIQLGADQGYARSSDVGEKQADGSYGANVNEGRTSTNAWCLGACYEHATTKHVLDKMSTTINMTDGNSEYLQLLRYEVPQFYQQHHDYIAYQKERQEGVRILTFFLYLNDVDAGGGTNFPLLNLTVMPKRGRALLWPSVLDESPFDKDGRTDHQALPVEKGIKYGANGWYHSRDFKEAYRRGCTG